MLCEVYYVSKFATLIRHFFPARALLCRFCKSERVERNLSLNVFNTIAHAITWIKIWQSSCYNHSKACRQKGEIYMAHKHTNEYQLKVVLSDGTEELSAWMHDQEQISEAMAVLRWKKPSSCWLRERRAVCPDCTNREQSILEYPFSDSGSPRYSPRNSRYLVAVGSRDRYQVSAAGKH